MLENTQNNNWGGMEMLFDSEDSDKSDVEIMRIPKTVREHPGLNMKHIAHVKQVNKWRRKSRSGAEDYLAISINAFVQSMGGNAIPAEALLARALGSEYVASKLTSMNSLDLSDPRIGILFIKAHCHFFRDVPGMITVKQNLFNLFAEAAIVVKSKVLLKELVAVCSDPCIKEDNAATEFQKRITRLAMFRA